MLRLASSGKALLLLGLCWLLPVPALAAEKTQAQIEARLKVLEAELLNYKKQMKDTQRQKSRVEEALEKNETSINKLIKRVEELERAMKAGREKVASLEARQQSLLKAKATQEGHLKQQLRAAHRMGKQEHLKLLMNQQDPHQLARMMKYYAYFSQARAKQIESYTHTHQQLANLAQALVRENLKLAKRRKALLADRDALRKAQQARHKTLAKLQQELAETGTQLARRQEDHRRLEGLLAKMQPRLAELPIPEPAIPFTSMKGKLLLPVAGRVQHSFGMPRSDGKLSWNGVLIRAPEGKPVHAVHYGQVVFSDWLRGFGLLLIINHGEGYMSLYGHNQVLYRQTGDWVDGDEVIAKVGSSGGQSATGLYFEIRDGRQATDPQSWCKARPDHSA